MRLLKPLIYALFATSFVAIPWQPSSAAPAERTILLDINGIPVVEFRTAMPIAGYRVLVDGVAKETHDLDGTSKRVYLLVDVHSGYSVHMNFDKDGNRAVFMPGYRGVQNQASVEPITTAPSPVQLGTGWTTIYGRAVVNSVTGEVEASMLVQLRGSDGVVRAKP